MKTTLLALLLSCASVLAQTAPITNLDAAASAEREAMLKRLLREAIIDDSNSAAARGLPAIPAATNAPIPAAVPTPAAVPAPVVVTNAVPAPAATSNATVQLVPIPAPAPIPAVAPVAVPPVVVVPIPVATAPAAVPAALPQSAPGIAPPGFAPAPAAAPAAVATNAVPEVVYQPGEVQFPDMDLYTFLDFYAKVVDKTVLRGAQLPPGVRISLKTQTPLTRSEAIAAFDTILAMNGVAIVNVDAKFVKAVPANLVAQEAARFIQGDGKELGEMDQYVNYVVHLKHVKPSEVVPVISQFAKMPGNILTVDSSQMLIIRDYASNVKRMLELVKDLDVEIPLEFDSEVIPIRYALVGDIQSALSSLGGSGGTTIGSSSSRGGAGVGGSGGINRPAVGGTYPGGAGGAANPFGATNPGQRVGGAAAANPSFTDRLRGLIGGGAGGDFQLLGPNKILADERTNSLLVFANKRDMEIIKKIVKQLDVVLAQVLIEAIIMEVSLDDTRNLGVSYLQSKPSTPGNYFKGIGGLNNGTFLTGNNFVQTGTNGPNLPGGFSYLGTFGNDFTATVTAIETDGRIRVLSKPRVQTSHGVKAVLRVGDNVPIVTGTYFGGINANASSQYQLQFVGISLEVKPLINADGLVVMEIVQDIQQLGTPTQIDGNPVPTTTQRYAEATVSVRDRDTILLGGFISTSKTKSKSGVPILMNIPGLGYLFRSTTDSARRVELIVMMRPTVLPTPESAALAATRERDSVPSFKGVEAEDRADRIRQSRAADRIRMSEEKP